VNDFNGFNAFYDINVLNPEPLDPEPTAAAKEKTFGVGG
jgi:hypothetical protein